MRKYCMHVHVVEALAPLRNLFLGVCLPHRQGKAMDPVFIKDFSDVFASFNNLMNIPETQLKGVHVVQVGGACCHGNISLMCYFPVTESDDGIFSSRSTRAATSLHSPWDCVSQLCLHMSGSIPYCWILCPGFIPPRVPFPCRVFVSDLLDSVQNRDVPSIPQQKLVFVTSILQSSVKLLDNGGTYDISSDVLSALT